MSIYFDKSNKEWLTMERLLIDSINECLIKQRSSTINIEKDLHSKKFLDYLQTIANTLKDAGVQSALMKMRRFNNEVFSPAQKRLLFELSCFCKQYWKNLSDVKFERTTQRTPMLKSMISRNTELLIHLRTVGKLPAIDFIENLDESTPFTEFSNSLFLASKTPPNPSWDSKKFLPPVDNRTINKPLLVLDIDETLLHTFLERPRKYDFEASIQYKTATITGKQQIINQKVYVNKRPYADHFFEVVSKFYEVITWTASIQNYADTVLNKLDPKHQYIKHRLYRRHCTQNPGNQYIKDLSRLGRPMHKIIIVDNSCLAFSFHLSHGIPIFPFIDDKNDTELLHLLPILIKLSKSNNISEELTKMYKLEQLKAEIKSDSC